jgi:hypothetical protein
MAGILTAGQDKAEQLEQLLAAALAPAAGALSVVSATAQQDATGLPSNVYVAITGGASGTVAVAIGPSNATATTVIPAANATLNQTVDFILPAGWWFKVTVGGSAAIASATQVTGV